MIWDNFFSIDLLGFPSMATTIKLPQLSDTMTEALIVGWRKFEGDTVNVGDIIAEITSNNISTEIESSESGTLLKILGEIGAKVQVGADLCVLGERGENLQFSVNSESLNCSTNANPNQSKVDTRNYATLMDSVLSDLFKSKALQQSRKQSESKISVDISPNCAKPELDVNTPCNDIPITADQLADNATPVSIPNTPNNNAPDSYFSLNGIGQEPAPAPCVAADVAGEMDESAQDSSDLSDSTFLEIRVEKGGVRTEKLAHALKNDKEAEDLSQKKVSEILERIQNLKKKKETDYEDADDSLFAEANDASINRVAAEEIAKIVDERENEQKETECKDDVECIELDELKLCDTAQSWQEDNVTELPAIEVKTCPDKDCSSPVSPPSSPLPDKNLGESKMEQFSVKAADIVGSNLSESDILEKSLKDAITSLKHQVDNGPISFEDSLLINNASDYLEDNEFDGQQVEIQKLKAKNDEYFVGATYEDLVGVEQLPKSQNNQPVQQSISPQPIQLDRANRINNDIIIDFDDEDELPNTDFSPTISHFYMTIKVVVDDLLDILATLRQSERYPGLSINHLIMKAVSIALSKNPGVNYRCNLETGDIEQSNIVNLGVVTPVNGRLFIPVVKNVDALSLADLSRRTLKLVKQVKAGEIAEHLLGTPTFCVSNVGNSAVENVGMSINTKFGAMLTQSAICTEPIVISPEELAVKSVLRLTFSADNSAVSTIIAVRFLNDLKTILEKPTLILV